MSRPKYYWYGIAKKMVTKYPDLNDDKSMQAGIFQKAIKCALDETRELPNGELRIKAIEDIYFRKIKTCEGVALEINYSPSTVHRWMNTFVNTVGKKAGY